MKKQNVKSYIAGFLTASILIGGASIINADSVIKTIPVQFDGIKLVLDGNAFVPKDEDGSIMEPFTYKGRTWLPVRAVAEALNKEVNWDAETSTVILGEYDQSQQPGDENEAALNTELTGCLGNTLGDLEQSTGKLTFDSYFMGTPYFKANTKFGEVSLLTDDFDMETTSYVKERCLGISGGINQLFLNLEEGAGREEFLNQIGAANITISVNDVNGGSEFNEKFKWIIRFQLPGKSFTILAVDRDKLGTEDRVIVWQE